MPIPTPTSDLGVVLYAAGAAPGITVKDRNGTALVAQSLGTTERKSSVIHAGRANTLLVSLVASTAMGTGNLTVRFVRQRQDPNNAELWPEETLRSIYNGTAGTSHAFAPASSIAASFRFADDHLLAGDIYAYVVTANAAANSDYAVLAVDAE